MIAYNGPHLQMTVKDLLVCTYLFKTIHKFSNKYKEECIFLHNKSRHLYIYIFFIMTIVTLCALCSVHSL